MGLEIIKLANWVSKYDPQQKLQKHGNCGWGFYLGGNWKRGGSILVSCLLCDKIPELLQNSLWESGGVNEKCSSGVMSLNSQWYCLGCYGTSGRSFLAGGGKSQKTLEIYSLLPFSIISCCYVFKVGDVISQLLCSALFCPFAATTLCCVEFIPLKPWNSNKKIFSTFWSLCFYHSSQQ